MTKQIRVLKTWQKEVSRQINDTKDLFSTRDWVIDPQFDFEALLSAYNNSSTISWIIKKISNSANVWFQEHKNQIIEDFLKSLDCLTIFSNMLIFGNCFMERLKDWFGNYTLDLKTIITPTFRIASENSEEIAYYQRSKRWITKVPFTKDEVLFIKRESVSDTYYWDSIFYNCIDEIILLAYITKYYKNFFKSWNIEPNVLYDESWTLTDEQIEKIEAMINDNISGIDNSQKTAIVPVKLWKIDLTTNIETDKIISLKRELKEDIAISTNIPFSLISPEDSNRATSTTDLNMLYSDIIVPMQKRFLQQLKEQLKSWNIDWVSEKDIDEINFYEQNLKDWLEEMKILTGYQKTWVLSVNEVREKAELWDSVDWWDEHVVIWWNQSNIWEVQEEMDKIKSDIKKLYDKKWKKKLSQS